MPILVSSRSAGSDVLGIPEIFKGLATTIRHLFRNLFNLKGLPTILYPEQKRNYSDRFRGRHVLKVRDDGTLKCVACYMCQTACPANCIDIVAGEHPNIAYEKYPLQFNIDMLRCVFCGYCVEACPKDAIIMTRDYELSMFHRGESLYTIEDLRQRLPVRQIDAGFRPYYGEDPTRKDETRYASQDAGTKVATSGH
jgi:NADH-quinone oxidoreductase subunit I